MSFVCDNFLERCGPDGGTRPSSICHICLRPRSLHDEPVDSWGAWIIGEVRAELRNTEMPGGAVPARDQPPSARASSEMNDG